MADEAATAPDARRSSKVRQRLRIVLAMLLLLAVSGLIVMGLWNWLVPSLFELRRVNFWEALGLLVLTRILFGGFRGPRRFRRRRMREESEVDGPGTHRKVAP